MGCCPRIMVLPLQGALPCGMFTQGVAPFHSACPGLRGVAPSGRVAMRFAVRDDAAFRSVALQVWLSLSDAEKDGHAAFFAR